MTNQSPAPVSGAVEALESILAICNETREARDLQPRMTEIRSIARATLAARSAPAVAEKVPLTPEQANNVWRRWVAARHVRCDWLSLLRLTEAAHGIGSGSAQEGQAK